MRERPIPFSAPMVRALLAGTKTQTRRAVKLPHMNPLGVWEPGTMGGPTMRTRKGETVPEHPVLGHSRTGDCIGPKWCTGDQLWVREAWRADAFHDLKPPRDIPPSAALMYEADGGACTFPLMTPGKLRPAMFMCRWMARTTLEVTDVRVERLHEISEADAIAEGAPGYEEGEDAPPPDPSFEWDYRASYRRVWEGLHGAGSWDENPWVWVIKFRRATDGVTATAKTADGGM